MVGGERERSVLQITAVATDSVLARIVVLLGSRGARVRSLSCTVEPRGIARIEVSVQTAPGRSRQLAAGLARVVDVLTVQREVEEVTPCV